MATATTARIIDVEGADGVGKSTALEALAALLCEEVGSSHPFDVTVFEKAFNRLPTLEEIHPARVLIVAEPTYSAPTGTAIRGKEGLLRSGRPYTVMEEAELYAADRARLYTDLVLRFLAADPRNWVLKSRGLASSLAYQAPRLEGRTSMAHAIDTLLELPGNRLELAHPPRDLIIFDLDPAKAQKRLEGRDRDRFEKDLALQQRVRAMYLTPELHAVFMKAGTTVRIIDASRSQEEIVATIIRTFKGSF